MKARVFAAALAAAAASAAAAQESGVELQDAVLPLEAMALEPGKADGEIWLKGMRLRTPLIAEQRVRFADAVVATSGQAAVPMPLVIVGRVAKGAGLPKEAAARAYCDLERGFQLIKGRGYNCYQDLDGDGRLEVQRKAVALNAAEPLTIAKIGPATAMTPLPYRVARPEERTSFRLVYESCGGGLDPIRFTQRVRAAGGGGIDYACTGTSKAIEVAKDGSGLYQLDRLVLKVTPMENSAKAEIVSAIPAGTLLDRIMPTEAVVDLGTRPSYEQELLEALTKFAKPPFIFAEAPKVNAGARKAADVLVEGRLGFSYTGRMAKTASISNLVSTREVKEGEKVYGVPMGGGLVNVSLGNRQNMIWCAPRFEKEKWRSACIPVNGGATHTIIEDLTPAFLVQGMSYRADTIVAAGAPEVSEEPVDFGTEVILRYRVTKWSRKEARVEVEIDSGSGKPDEMRMWVRRGPDGVAAFELGGARFRLSPVGEDGYTVSMEGYPRSGATALPTGDVRSLIL